ncbi:MAG: hypothetical protein Q9218_001159 [Villophora microphyllina]
MPALNPPPEHEKLSAPEKSTPAFSPDTVSVIYVLGGPGAGKGTQCANLVRDYGFKHLSAGDLLRAEQDRPDSQFGNMIKEYIRDGKIVPMEVTVHLLENAMTEDIKGRQEGHQSRFLIDGFPRQMDQALRFESAVCPSKFTLFFDCPEDVMQERLINRGKTSGRADDNAESITKRFRTFVETSMPVVDYFEKQGKVVKVKAVKGPDEIYEEVKRRMGERGFEMRNSTGYKSQVFRLIVVLFNYCQVQGLVRLSGNPKRIDEERQALDFTPVTGTLASSLEVCCKFLQELTTQLSEARLEDMTRTHHAIPSRSSPEPSPHGSQASGEGPDKADSPNLHQPQPRSESPNKADNPTVHQPQSRRESPEKADSPTAERTTQAVDEFEVPADNFEVSSDLFSTYSRVSSKFDKDGRPLLEPFVKAVLDEAVTFMDDIVPNRFRETSEKSSPPAGSKVQVYKHEIPGQLLSEINWERGQMPRNPPPDIGKTGEVWFARASKHPDKQEKGTATFSEFEFGLRDNHSEHEAEYTPDVFDARLVLDWLILQPPHVNAPDFANYKNVSMRSAYSMIHVRIDRIPDADSL